MLTAKQINSGLKLLARDAQKQDGPYSCPVCETLVTLKKGNKKIHHFAHKPPVTCTYGSGETLAHQEAKLGLFDALKTKANVSAVEVEKRMGFGSIADVYAEINGQRVAIEIQRSTISTAEISRRTELYHRNGVAVLWVVLKKPNYNPQKYSPNEMERWLHAAYIKHLYFWAGGETLQVAQFTPYKQYVEARSWYQDGSEQSAGGYFKTMRRWVVLKTGPTVDISQDFDVKKYSAWAYRHIDLPARTVFAA